MLPFFVLAAIFASNAAYVLTPVFSEQPWQLWDMAFFIVLAALGFAVLTLFDGGRLPGDALKLLCDEMRAPRRIPARLMLSKLEVIDPDGNPHV